MFDAMVSMAFNMGVYGFVTCDFLEDLKNKDYTTAAEKIKTTRINGKVKNSKGKWETVEMPGLLDRRLIEYELFSKDIT
jgi:GH24 family phage-related lysozyme (muramidase)